MTEKTLYNWLNAWDESGLVAKLNDEQKAQVKRWVEASPRQLKPVIEKIKKTWEIDVSLSTLKRVLKA